MKNTFREYYQFTEQEIKELCGKSLFVFDANTLLNIYRYSRPTVEIYLNVLKKLKEKQQIWIPYQVGLEFFKNRINVIHSYEKSYDELLSILNNFIKSISEKFKEHPFLNIKDINNKINEGLSSVIKHVNEAKDRHPKWLKKDDVLERLTSLFEGNTGINYLPEKINEIKAEAQKRYDNKIPPGYKDKDKSVDNQYGDYIIWRQIIDKAQEIKKSIIFISDDVKEDWWLISKNNNRIMPLPQLKKELNEKAGVDFHIYTSDKFLEFFNIEENTVTEQSIKEVKNIREKENFIKQLDESENEAIFQELKNRRDFHKMSNHLNLIDKLIKLLNIIEKTKEFQNRLVEIYSITLDLEIIKNNINQNYYNSLNEYELIDKLLYFSFNIKNLFKSIDFSNDNLEKIINQIILKLSFSKNQFLKTKSFEEIV